MRPIRFGGLVPLCLLLFALPARAEAPPARTKTHRFLGVHADLGVPDGGGIGLVGRPWPWLRVAAAYTHNGFASGVRGGVTLDPIDFPLALTLTLEGGRAFEGTVKGKWLGVQDDVRMKYDYANLHLGLELGDRDNFRLYLRGGLSAIALDTSDFTKRSEPGEPTTSVSGLHARGTLFGTAKLGFATYW